MLIRLLAFFGAILCACVGALAAQPEKRVALVIGAANYDKLPALKDADQDAAAMAGLLQRLGFRVTSAINPDLTALRSALASFQRDATGADAVLVFYAGHAVRWREAAYLVPTGATLRDETSIEWDTLPLRQMIDAIPHAANAFLVIDGCGQQRLAPALSDLGAGASAGFAEPPSARDMFVVMSTSTRDEACESPLRSSLLPRTLMMEMQQTGLDASQVIERVNQGVSRRSGGRQNVEFSGVLPRAFRFSLAEQPYAAFRRLGADPSPNDLGAFVAQFGQDELAGPARELLSARQKVSLVAPDPWRGRLGGDWREERANKGRARRYDAIEARWSREDADRAIAREAAEKLRQEQEQAAREKFEKEEQARIAREREDQQRRQAEILAAEQRRQAQERIEREKGEQEARARQLRDLEENRRRQAEAAAAEQRRAEQERVERERVQREEQARLAREREEQQRRQAELFAADQRRLAQERVDREKAEQETRARQARELEENRRRQAEAAAIELRRAEQERADREKAEQETLARQARELEEQRRRTEEQRLAAASTSLSGQAPANVGGAAVDEANRFTAEQRRLAQERLDRERRAKGAPGEIAAPLPSETGAQLAALAPPGSDRPSTSLDAPKPGSPEFIKATQDELKRMGCYAGAVNGQATGALKSALDAAAKKIGGGFSIEPQTEAMLQTLRSQKDGLCGPLVCGAGQTRRGDICVAARAPAAEPRERPAARPAPRPAARQAAKPAAQPAGGGGGARGGCFAFNGRQYCQ